MPAGDRARLEHLCRYVLRPPIVQGALECTAGGKNLLQIRRPWRDGTRAIAFTPSELLEKRVVMIPNPSVNLLIYHGVLGPSAQLRRGAVSAALAASSTHGVPSCEEGHEGEAAAPDAPAEGQPVIATANATATPGTAASKRPTPPSGIVPSEDRAEAASER